MRREQIAPGPGQRWQGVGGWLVAASEFSMLLIFALTGAALYAINEYATGRDGFPPLALLVTCLVAYLVSGTAFSVGMLCQKRANRIRADHVRRVQLQRRLPAITTFVEEGEASPR